MKYKFDFDRFTVGHLMALKSRDHDAILWAINDLLVGSIANLPMGELEPLMEQFAAELEVFAAKVRKHTSRKGESGDDWLRADLEDVKGL